MENKLGGGDAKGSQEVLSMDANDYTLLFGSETPNLLDYWYYRRI